MVGASTGSGLKYVVDPVFRPAFSCLEDAEGEAFLRPFLTEMIPGGLAAIIWGKIVDSVQKMPQMELSFKIERNSAFLIGWGAQRNDTT